MNHDNETIHVPPNLLTLPVDDRIEYTEGLINQVARSIWGEVFDENDKAKMQDASNRILTSVKRTQKLSLHLLEND